MLAPFAAISRLLVAAEGGAEIGAGAVQMNVAGAKLRRDFPRMIEIAGLDIAGKAIDRVVGKPDHLLLAVIGEDREDRPEDLLARDGHLGDRKSTRLNSS